MKFREYVKESIEVIKDRDPAMKSNREVFLYPCFWAIWEYRKAHKYYLKGKFYKARKSRRRLQERPELKYTRAHRLEKVFYRSRTWCCNRGDNNNRRQCYDLSGSNSRRHRQGTWQAAPYYR